MIKSNSITKFDNSLTEFLINALSDKYGDSKSYAYRYNNLKVFMDPRRVATPHFFVSVGISEACFAISDGKKLDGGLGVEDAYVRRWSDRANIKRELETHWKLLKDAITAEEDDDMSKKTFAISRLKKAEQANDTLQVDMTGTGVIRKEIKKSMKNIQKKDIQQKEDVQSQDTQAEKDL
jgi:hypothetical protein